MPVHDSPPLWKEVFDEVFPRERPHLAGGNLHARPFHGCREGGVPDTVRQDYGGAAGRADYSSLHPALGRPPLCGVPPCERQRERQGLPYLRPCHRENQGQRRRAPQPLAVGASRGRGGGTGHAAGTGSRFQGKTAGGSCGRIRAAFLLQIHSAPQMAACRPALRSARGDDHGLLPALHLAECGGHRHSGAQHGLHRPHDGHAADDFPLTDHGHVHAGLGVAPCQHGHQRAPHLRLSGQTGQNAAALLRGEDAG